MDTIRTIAITIRAKLAKKFSEQTRTICTICYSVLQMAIKNCSDKILTTRFTIKINSHPVINKLKSCRRIYSAKIVYLCCFDAKNIRSSIKFYICTVDPPTNINRVGKVSSTVGATTRITAAGTTSNGLEDAVVAFPPTPQTIGIPFWGYRTNSGTFAPSGNNTNPAYNSPSTEGSSTWAGCTPLTEPPHRGQHRATQQAHCLDKITSRNHRYLHNENTKGSNMEIA